MERKFCDQRDELLSGLRLLTANGQNMTNKFELPLNQLLYYKT